MRDEAVLKNDGERMQAWAGQSARLAPAVGSEQVVTDVWEGTQSLLS